MESYEMEIPPPLPERELVGRLANVEVYRFCDCNIAHNSVHSSPTEINGIQTHETEQICSLNG